MSTHGGFEQLGPEDFAGEADAARDRDSKQVPAEPGPLHPVAANDDIERLHEPLPEQLAQ